jgi:hypothetical protein
VDRLSVGTKLDAASPRIGAGEVQLESGDPGGAVELGNDFSIFLGVEANHVDQYMRPMDPRSQPR